MWRRYFFITLIHPSIQASQKRRRDVWGRIGINGEEEEEEVEAVRQTHCDC